MESINSIADNEEKWTQKQQQQQHVWSRTHDDNDWIVIETN